MFNITRTLCVAALAALVAPAFAAEWMTDLDAAKAKAAAEGKAVLVDFTGSDWCGWCIRLRKDVFDKPEFEAYAKDKFVLMEVDVPHSPSADQEMVKRNRAICEQFMVDGFPTIMVLTPEGQVVGGFSGYRPSVAEAAKPLDAALETVSALKEAELKQGDEKVKALYAIYEQMPKDLRGTLRARLVELDVNNITGIQDVVKAQKQLSEVQKKLIVATQTGQTPKAMLAIVDEALTDAYPQNRATLLQFKVGLLLSLAETLEDLQVAKETLLQMAEADPENAAAIRAAAAQQFAQPEKLLQAIKARRSASGM